jgi:Ca-activated chloride channel family protein
MNSAKVSLKLFGLMLVFAFASTAFAQNPAPTPPKEKPIIINEDLITLNVTVTDSFGRYVSGLKKNAFTIFDDDEKQEIEFFSDDDAPVSVGIVFDVSGSMKGEKLTRAREALAKFVQTSHPRDEYFLIAFNKRAQLLLDRTRDGEAVLNKLQLVQAKDNTALYDAVYLGTERVTRGTHQKRAIILISDGQDNNSRYTFNDVKKQIKESDLTLYSIGILGGGDNGGLGVMGQAYLDELSSVTGGSSFYPKTNAEMDEIFERIALELRNQYSIGFRPQNFTNDGKWHKLKVKVKPPRGLPKLFVRTREGYFATVAPR